MKYLLMVCFCMLPPFVWGRLGVLNLSSSLIFLLFYSALSLLTFKSYSFNRRKLSLFAISTLFPVGSFFLCYLLGRDLPSLYPLVTLLLLNLTLSLPLSARISFARFLYFLGALATISALCTYILAIMGAAMPLTILDLSYNYVLTPAGLAVVRSQLPLLLRYRPTFLFYEPSYLATLLVIYISCSKNIFAMGNISSSKLIPKMLTYCAGLATLSLSFIIGSVTTWLINEDKILPRLFKLKLLFNNLSAFVAMLSLALPITFFVINSANSIFDRILRIEEYSHALFTSFDPADFFLGNSQLESLADMSFGVSDGYTAMIINSGFITLVCFYLFIYCLSDSFRALFLCFVLSFVVDLSALPIVLLPFMASRFSKKEFKP